MWQAIQHSVPVVATGAATEGPLSQEGGGCLTAESPEQFAEKMKRLLTDCGLWQQLVEGGARVAREQLGAERARKALLQVRVVQWGEP